MGRPKGSKNKKDELKESINVVKGSKIVCLTCKRMNRAQDVSEDICFTCKRSNRKQEIIYI